MMSAIINIETLQQIRNNPDVLIFDVSNNKNARSNYENMHLEGAYFADINSQLADIKPDVAVGGRHPLPSIHYFSET